MFVGPDGELPLPWLRPTLAMAAAQKGHAVLLHGGQGRGLLELAMTLAQRLLCSADVQERPCGRCAECHLIGTHIHPDLHVLMPAALKEAVAWQSAGDGDERERGTKPSQEIRIDDMRAAIDWGTRSVSRARLKVLVVHPASSMNAVTANALLKTLEEPAGQLQLILTASSPGDLLPTLASRCQHVRLPMPSPSESLHWLKLQGVADAQTLLQAAGGEPLAARDLAAAGVDAALWRGLPARIQRGDATVLAGWSVATAVDALFKLCHDAMCVAADAPTRYFEAATVPGGASWDALRLWSIELGQTARHAEHPWQAALAIEALVSRASRAWQGQTPKARPLGTLGPR